MNIAAKAVSKKALMLPAKSRAELANMLLGSLGNYKNKSFEAKWLKEAKKRDQDISNGSVTCKTHDEIMKSVFKAI